MSSFRPFFYCDLFFFFSRTSSTGGVTRVGTSLDRFRSNAKPLETQLRGRLLQQPRLQTLIQQFGELPLFTLRSQTNTNLNCLKPRRVSKMAELRPFTPPAKKYLAGPAPRDVRFRHPAYPDSAPDLLVLTAADGDGGLSFDRASEACCIVAGVNWDGGYLALKASENNDLQRVDRPQDGLLRLREYFFCVHGLCMSSSSSPNAPRSASFMPNSRGDITNNYLSRCSQISRCPIVPTLALPARLRGRWHATR